MNSTLIFPLALLFLPSNCFVGGAARPVNEAESSTKGEATAQIKLEHEKGQQTDCEPRPDTKQEVIATCAAFSPDNKYVLVGFGGGSRKARPKRTALADALILWEVASGKEVRLFKGHAGGVTFVAFTPDGKTAISGGEDGQIIVWNVGTGMEIRRFLTGRFRRGTIDAGCLRLLGQPHNEGRELQLWNIADGEFVRSIKMTSDIYFIEFDPDGKNSIVSCRPAELWDMTKRSDPITFPVEIAGVSYAKKGHSFQPVNGLGSPHAFHPKEKTLVLTKYKGHEHALAIWDIEKRTELREIGDKELWPIEVHVDSKGSIICLSREGRLVSWRYDGKERWNLESKYLQRYRLFVFGRDGQYALSGSGMLNIPGEFGPVYIDLPSTFSLRVWDLRHGKMLREVELPRLPEK